MREARPDVLFISHFTLSLSVAVTYQPGRWWSVLTLAIVAHWLGSSQAYGQWTNARFHQQA